MVSVTNNQSTVTTHDHLQYKGIHTYHLIRFTGAKERVDDGDAGVQRRHAGAGLVIPVDHDVVCSRIGVGGSAGLHTLQLAKVPRLRINNLQEDRENLSRRRAANKPWPKFSQSQRRPLK